MGEITWGTAAAVLAAPLVFLLPGWALLSLVLPPESFEPKNRPDMASWLVLAAGMTLALTPIELLILHLLGLRVSSGLVLGYLAVSAIVVVWRGIARGKRGEIEAAGQEGRRVAPSEVQSDAPLLRGRQAPLAWVARGSPLLVLILVMALVLGVRLWVVRGVNVGFWGDSYQHTLITQLILDNGGLFDSWEPYAPLTTFTYHFGFHANVALFQWATGWFTHNLTPRTIVLVGQMLNALAALVLYPLAMRLTGGKRWVGVAAVVVAGLLTPMPMYYVNWGRYTQLAGQILLPVALWFTMEAVEASRRDLRRLALATVAVAGLAMTHYLVLAFYVAFVIPYLAVWLVRRWGNWREWREAAVRLGIIAALAILLVLPWGVRIMSGYLPFLLDSMVRNKVSQEYIQQHSAVQPLTQFLPLYLAVLALAGGAWALLRRQQTALVLAWVGSLFLTSNPSWLGLPGRGVISNFAVELALYIPAAILAAGLAGSLLDHAWRRRPQARPGILFVGVAVLVVAAGTGIGQQKDILDPQFQLVTPADEEALAWVRQNTPQDARFLINSFFAYGGGLIAGSDAGWWLPLLGGRQNTVPPLNYGNEAGPDPGYWQRVNDLTRRLEELSMDDPAAVRTLQERGITHIFVGEKGGPLLDVQVLAASPHYRLIYPPHAAGETLPDLMGGPLVFEVVTP